MAHSLGRSAEVRLADGRALHYMIAGTDSGVGPTVVFESGLGASVDDA